jgi:L-amino acid N-acyltransferase
MQFIQCNYEQHAPSILKIFNHAILNSTALYEYQPRTLETMTQWFAAKTAGGFPVIGAVSQDGRFLGFASYGSFRSFPAYKYTVEHSIYVDEQYRGQGTGKALLQEVIRVAQQDQRHVLVGGIDASNHASIALHQQLGFTHCGTLTQTGFKFGRWLDLAFYQLTLPTPNLPIDG